MPIEDSSVDKRPFFEVQILLDAFRVTEHIAAGINLVKASDNQLNMLDLPRPDIRIVGAQLGQTQIQTTMRYAHVAMDPLRRATNQVSGVIAALALGQTDDNGAPELG